MPAIITRDAEQLSFQAYVTDTLQAIAENTATPAAWLTDGRTGKTIGRRWIERDKPAPPEEIRTADEIISNIKGKLAALGGEGE